MCYKISNLTYNKIYANIIIAIAKVVQNIVTKKD